MASLKTFDRQGKSYGLGFMTNGKLCFFSHSLYWLMRHVGLIELRLELLDDGESVLYGEMTCRDIEILIESGRLSLVKFHIWGISWSFKGQPQGGDDDFSGYPRWRDEMLNICESECGRVSSFCQ